MYGLPDTLRPLSAAEEQVMPGRSGAAGHQPEAQGHRLGSSHGAELSLPVGGKRLGQVGKTGQLQRVCAAGHPAGLRRVLYAAAAGYPV